MAEAPWYSGGLRFECRRCGNCCGGSPGTVRVTEQEVAALARRLGLRDFEFRARYTRALRDGELSLREKRNKDCVFYDRRRGCKVYPDRPRQCRTWPFWRSVVASPEGWAEEAERCPGMNSGVLYSAEFIGLTSRDDGNSGRAPAPAG